MNERFKELAEQADKFAKENCTQTISGPGNNYFELFHEKFAELIIEECISVLTLTEESALKMNLSGYMLKLVTGIGNQYANGIKENFFGVEECL
jgi:hypothetical protein